MAKPFRPHIATGNNLREGHVVYFTAEGGWSRSLGDAAVARSQEEADALLASAQSFPNEVVDVYVTFVDLDDQGKPRPAHFREDFRLKGPSNRPEHGRANAIGV